ncbi:TetR/AcrR family transcriptional regulator [Kineococcus glutinatus]|uniref:TetR family transcriptional regulator n=1 Tax=Kineococcus glutinatus TaxID=1070872 RepID=A0ABP9HVK8_9ACTN
MSPPAGPAADPAADRPPGLRERKKAATRRRIQEVALELFLRKGFEATTVAEVAAAAGVSHMTFFRNFPTKEAVVENDGYDPVIAALIRARPAAEPAATALHNALREGIAAVDGADRDTLLARTRLVLTTPALRAHVADSQRATVRLFGDALAERTGGPVSYELRVVAAAALGAVTLALEAWVEGDGREGLPGLVDRALAVLER